VPLVVNSTCLNFACLVAFYSSPCYILPYNIRQTPWTGHPPFQGLVFTNIKRQSRERDSKPRWCSLTNRSLCEKFNA